MFSSWRSPSFWIYISLFILFVIWIFQGGKSYEYVGLDPLLHNTPIPDDLRSTLPIIEQSRIPQKETVVEDPKSNKFESRGEAITRQTLEKIYSKKFPCIRPDFLKNPETGQNLELDCYNEELSIAAEYSGAQHYVYPNSFHKSYDAFLQQLRRDEYKCRRCEEEGIYLIRVPYTIPFAQIPDYIWKRLPENRTYFPDVE